MGDVVAVSESVKPARPSEAEDVVAVSKGVKPACLVVHICSFHFRLVPWLVHLHFSLGWTSFGVCSLRHCVSIGVPASAARVVLVTRATILSNHCTLVISKLAFAD